VRLKPIAIIVASEAGEKLRRVRRESFEASRRVSRGFGQGPGPNAIALSQIDAAVRAYAAWPPCCAKVDRNLPIVPRSAAKQAVSATKSSVDNR
jgi:hypothetical protein